jgi:hypothetical protein
MHGGVFLSRPLIDFSPMSRCPLSEVKTETAPRHELGLAVRFWKDGFPLLSNQIDYPFVAATPSQR